MEAFVFRWRNGEEDDWDHNVEGGAGRDGVVDGDGVMDGEEDDWDHNVEGCAVDCEGAN